MLFIRPDVATVKVRQHPVTFDGEQTRLVACQNTIVLDSWSVGSSAACRPTGRPPALLHSGDNRSSRSRFQVWRRGSLLAARPTRTCGRRCAAVLVLAPVEAAGIAGGIATTVRTVAMTIGPATAALAWTWAGGADPGFEAGVLTLSAAAAAGLLVLLPVVRTHGGNPSRQSARASRSRPTTTDQGGLGHLARAGLGPPTTPAVAASR